MSSNYTSLDFQNKKMSLKSNPSKGSLDRRMRLSFTIGHCDICNCNFGDKDEVMSHFKDTRLSHHSKPGKLCKRFYHIYLAEDPYGPCELAMSFKKFKELSLKEAKEKKAKMNQSKFPSSSESGSDGLVPAGGRGAGAGGRGAGAGGRGAGAAGGAGRGGGRVGEGRCGGGRRGGVLPF